MPENPSKNVEPPGGHSAAGDRASDSARMSITKDRTSGNSLHLSPFLAVSKPWGPIFPCQACTAPVQVWRRRYGRSALVVDVGTRARHHCPVPAQIAPDIIVDELECLCGQAVEVTAGGEKRNLNRESHICKQLATAKPLGPKPASANVEHFSMYDAPPDISCEVGPRPYTKKRSPRVLSKISIKVAD